MTLVPGDPLAHRALESLLRAEANVRRQLAVDLEREGLSSTGFFVLVVLSSAGGELELRRLRLQTSKANATEVVDTLVRHGLVLRRRLDTDRRAVGITLTAAGADVVARLFPQHTDQVQRTFSVLDEDEKRSLAAICRKLAA